MTMKPRILITGAIAGALGAVLTLAAVSARDRTSGGFLGLPGAAGAGAAGAWIGRASSAGK